VVPGEDTAVFIAGVMVLAGALLGLLGHGRAHAEKPDAAAFELVSLALASFGTALGLWSLAGKGGGLLAIAIGVFLGFSLLIIVSGKAIAKRKQEDKDAEPEQDERPPHG
jgi:membrane protease YdiL (CAAX protease family)